MLSHEGGSNFDQFWRALHSFAPDETHGGRLGHETPDGLSSRLQSSVQATSLRGCKSTDSQMTRKTMPSDKTWQENPHIS